MNLEDARRIIAAAEKKAKQIGQPMNIAVADEGGNLVSHIRMDGAWLGSIDISIKKAYTSRAFDLATKDLATHSQSGGQFFGIHASNDGKIMIFAGGIPLKQRRQSSGSYRGKRRLWRAGPRSSRSWCGGVLVAVAGVRFLCSSGDAEIVFRFGRRLCTLVIEDIRRSGSN